MIFLATGRFAPAKSLRDSCTTFLLATSQQIFNSNKKQPPNTVGHEIFKIF